ADEDELERISVYSMVGQDITNSVKITKVSSTQLSVNVAALKPGMYILKTKTTTQKITKQ
ncbi:MAG: T9SS type A sorting domain-containing protein, partial [Ferruginibacter sp.]